MSHTRGNCQKRKDSREKFRREKLSKREEKIRGINFERGIMKERFVSLLLHDFILFFCGLDVRVLILKS
jgi:hypothetical protein